MSEEIILAIIGAGEVVLLTAIRQVHNKVKACGEKDCLETVKRFNHFEAKTSLSGTNGQTDQNADLAKIQVDS